MLKKSYEANYSGLRSENFFKWLNDCKESCTQRAPTKTFEKVNIERRNITVVQSAPKPVQHIAETITKVVNSKVKFTYTSPSHNKNTI